MPPKYAHTTHQATADRLRHLAVALLAAFVIGQPAHAQSLTFGSLSGSVLDAGSAPIRGAQVRAVERVSGAERWAAVDRDGRFEFGVLAAGRYDVTAEALGFRPATMVDVAIAAGHAARIELVLQPALPPVTGIDTVRATNAAGASLSWLFDRGYADLVGNRRTLGDAALLSSSASEFAIEGLPWRFAETVVDGSRSSAFGSPASDGAEAAGLAFPLGGLAGVRVGGIGFDVEAGGTGVGLGARSLRAGQVGELRGAIEGGAATYGGSVVAGGPLQGDTAQAIIGAEYQRNEVTRPALFGADPIFAGAFTDAALNAHGVDLSAYADEAKRLDERWSGFTRLDFQPSDRFAVNVRASGSRLTSSGLPESTGLNARFGTDYEAVMAQAALNVFARLGGRFTQEIRVSADVADASSTGSALARTTLAGAGLTIGSAATEPFDDSRTTPRAAAILHVDLGAHQLKAGVAVASHRLDSRYATGAAGAFRFGDAVDLAAAEGAWRGVEGSVPAGQFSMAERAYFLQDAWNVTDGLSVSLGARFDDMRLPDGEIERNADWLAVSGLDNRAVESSYSGFAPRLGVRWELGRDREWVIEGGAGTFRSLPDDRSLAEALTFDRSTVVRYGTGALGDWPAAPSTAVAPEVGRTVTMLGPDFEGPRTRRFALGITRQAGAWSTFANGVYRHTDFLARRRDLNLPVVPTGVDQDGRPLFGDLEQVGSLLAVAPGTNRRFGDFDAVHALESSGFSDYWGVTVGAERVQEAGLSLAFSYTFSRTTDNVPGLGRGATLSPFPDGLNGVDWTEGTSDFDVPHRLLAAADWSTGPSGALRLGAVYRLQAGTPFTPGVRDGVDANGDGAWGNDPAFVRSGLPGMTAAMEDQTCLRKALGGFVERNSCRTEMQHRLDLRASFLIAQLYAGRLELVIDALDVIATERGRVDDALLLVDRTGAVTTDAGTGVTNVPYTVNPNFGQVLADRSPGVLWRVGLRIVP